MRRHPLQDGVAEIMTDGQWHTLQEMADRLGTCYYSVGCQISRLRQRLGIETEWAAADGRGFKRYRIKERSETNEQEKDQAAGIQATAQA